MPYDKETRDTLKRMILPEISLPSMTKNIHPRNCRFMPRQFFVQSWLKLLPELVSSCIALCSGRNKNETAIKAQVAD